MVASRPYLNGNGVTLYEDDDALAR
jgi:hypothetical protein